MRTQVCSVPARRQRPAALAASELATPGEATVYTDAQLWRKTREDRKRSALREDDMESPYQEEVVFSVVFESLIDAAGLTFAQATVIRLATCGASATDIAESLGLRRQPVSRILRAARAKLARAAFDGPYAGWHEVYLSEVRRRCRKR